MDKLTREKSLAQQLKAQQANYKKEKRRVQNYE
jgi:hypothetical protein